MKKFVSILLCVALLCSMVVVVAQADGDPQMSVASATVLPGATVTLDINVLNNPGIASLGLDFENKNGLAVTYAGADNGGDSLNLTANDAAGSYFWVGAYNSTLTTMGTMTLTIDENAEPGVYTFDVDARDSVNATADVIDIADTTFTITVSDKIITGVNVAIDAGLAIGIHVLAADPEETSIVALNEAKEEYTIIEDYVEDGEGGYIYYINVNPWDMDQEFLVDFTDNFDIDEETDNLSLLNLPETARTTGILSYCEAVQGTSDELDQLIADLLAFGQQAQLYNGAEAPSFALPDGLVATEAAWENGDGDPCDFGTFCSENFPEDLTPKNATAKKKFKFDYATINFGSKFEVVFTFANNGTDTASNLARVKANGETYALDGWNFTYAFSPAEYGGVQFDLYGAASTTATNFAFINVYGPAHYAAYAYENGAEDGLMSILEAFYLYGASVEAYVATLGE